MAFIDNAEGYRNKRSFFNLLKVRSIGSPRSAQKVMTMKNVHYQKKLSTLRYHILTLVSTRRRRQKIQSTAKSARYDCLNDYDMDSRSSFIFHQWRLQSASIIPQENAKS